MKIGIISTYFYPFIGGAESNAYFTAKELAKRHEVHVFTSDRKNSHIIKKKEEKIGNIHIHRAKTWFRYGYYLTFYPKLVTNLLKYNLDIIHVHSLGFINHDIAILLKKIQSPKTKFVITPHGPIMAQQKYSFWKNILKFLTINFEKSINLIYDKVIQVNPYQKEWLTKEYGFSENKIVYIPNGIDRSIFKKSRKIFENRFIISYIGRLKEYKGVQHVIKILPDLIKKNNNLLFVIIGKDEGYYNELKNLVRKLKLENNIKFLTNSGDKQRDEFLESSEIFLMPSEWEAFGISILEAMAKGNAIISTKTEGGKFLVSENNGLLYDFEDEESLKKNLEILISNSIVREKMQKANIKKAKEFTWDKIAKTIEEEYKKCYQ